MKTFIAIILIFTSLTKANACICPEFNSETMQKLVETADFVVYGKAITNVHFDQKMEQLLNLKNEGADVLFEVDSVIKGNIQKNEKLFIYQEGGSCTHIFEFGENYIIFGDYIKKFKRHKYDNKEGLPPPPPPPLENEELEIHADKKIIKFLNKQTTKYITGTTNLCSSIQMEANKFHEVLEQINK